MVSTPMSIARAFTKRTKRSHEPSTPARGTSMKYPAGTINRNLISLPTELISTTNVHALTAPDIATLNNLNSSTDSGNESDFSHIDTSFLNTPVLSSSGDTSSIDSSPITPITPDLGDGKGFFDCPHKRASTIASPRTSGSVTILDAPALPQRALSHSKKAHIELSRKRSIQRMSPLPTTLSQAASVRTSVDVFSVNGEADHPFHNELAQVNEVAEEFGVASTVAGEEQEMQSRGLMKFGVEDYLDEIAGLYGGIFEDRLGPLGRPWV